MPRQLRPEDYTVGWVCALPIELAAALEMLDEEHGSAQRFDNDENLYQLGSIAGYNVVIACLPAGRIGNNPAAAVATQMKATFKGIQFGLMVGIGGGVPRAEADIRLGDVVVSQPDKTSGGVIQHDFGKSTASEVMRTGSLNVPPPILLAAMVRVQMNEARERSKVSEHIARLNHVPIFQRHKAGPDILFEPTYDHESNEHTCDKCSTARQEARQPRKNREVVVHYGTIASGNQVIKNAVERDKISANLGDVLCFEMEAAGLMSNFPCLVIRGICDYADSHKNKRWQPYAAATAAAYAKEVLLAIPQTNVRNSRMLDETIRSTGEEAKLLHQYIQQDSYPSTTNLLRCDDYHVAWICPLGGVGLLSARLMLDEEHIIPPYDTQKDRNTYICGTINGHTVVIATCSESEMGNVNAERLTVPLFKTFPSIRVTVLVGIGSGIPRQICSEDPLNTIRLGDVVVGWTDDGKPACVYHDRGSSKVGGQFEMLRTMQDPDWRLISALKIIDSCHNFSRIKFHDHLARLRKFIEFAHPGLEHDRLFRASYHHIREGGLDCTKCDQNELVQRPQRSEGDTHESVFHQGRIATGDSFIHDGELRDQIGARCDGAICVEMAASSFAFDRRCLVICGISDYADSHRNHLWRSHAAGNAAAFTREMLCSIHSTVIKDIEAVTSPSILNTAIFANHTALVANLIASGANVNQPFEPEEIGLFYNNMPYGYPIRCAVAVGKEMTKLLIDADVNVNATSKQYGTALQHAAGWGTLETMELLITAGADVNAAPGACDTALISAISSRLDSFEKVRLLLRHGADVSVPSFDHMDTPLQRALKFGHIALLPVFIACGVDVAATSELWQKHNGQPLPELWLQLSHGRPYASVSQFMTDVEDASAANTVKGIKFDWRVPELLGSESKTGDSVEHKEHPLVDSFMGQLLLVDDHPEDLEVTTIIGAACVDCVRNYWGQDGVDLLRCLLNNIFHQRPGSSEHEPMFHIDHGVLPCEYVSAVRLFNGQVELEFKTASQNPKNLYLILDVVSFFCRAINSPESSTLLLKTSSIINVRVTRLEDMEAERSLVLHVSVNEEPLQIQESSCWQKLFSSGIVAQYNQLEHVSSAPGRGLSVCFEDMLALASVDYSAVIGETIILLGYRTALIPIEIYADYVQYHLLICDSGQMDPFKFPKELSLAVNVADIEELRKRQSVIGWCREAYISLGTDAVNNTPIPRESGAKAKGRSVQLNGITAGFSIVSAAPIQAGPNFQVSGKFVVNRVQFPNSEVYSQILRDTSMETALLYDTDSKQAWIVPKLYLLLHMCHIHMITRNEHDVIPFAPDGIDPKPLVSMLDGKGDLVLYGVPPDELRFRVLLRGLNVNLLTTAVKTQRSKNETLYGYDFVDIVNNPGKGAWMRKTNIKNSASGVIQMANLIDVAIIGAGFQNVIQPLIQRVGANPNKCISVPEGLDYLIVPVSCLMKLVSGRCTVDGSSRGCEVEIADGLYWVVSMASFALCNHSGGNGECCWHSEETFQELRQSSWNWTRAPSGGTQQISLIAIPGRGAVVFGKPRRP